MEWMTPEWLAAATALVAVMVGPIVSVAVARSQIRATLRAAAQQYEATAVSTARNRWLEQLREAVAELSASTAALGLDHDLPAMSSPERGVKLERAFLLMQKVMLLVDHDDEEHVELVKTLNSAMDAAITDMATGDRAGDLGKLSGEIGVRARRILEKEWGRIANPSLSQP